MQCHILSIHVMSNHVMTAKSYLYGGNHFPFPRFVRSENSNQAPDSGAPEPEGDVHIDHSIDLSFTPVQLTKS